MTDKIPTLVETGLFNNGKRSALDTTLGPGATAYPHYHTLFAESFKLLSGSLTVITAPEGVLDTAAMEEYALEVGQTATIPRYTAHKFLAGPNGCRVLTSFEPAALGFERIALIMRGLQADANYHEFGSGANEENALFLSVFEDLSDSHPLMNSDIEMIKSQDGEKHSRLKQELIDKYATDDMIKAAVEQNLQRVST